MNTIPQTKSELPDTETPIPIARPAGLSNQCEEYLKNPLFIGCDQESLPDAPLLVRCKSQAGWRLTLRNGEDVYSVKFCGWHCQLLKTRIGAGLSLVEILDEQELEAHR